jgi:hypothetical protein
MFFSERGLRSVVYGEKARHIHKAPKIELGLKLVFVPDLPNGE